jgi:acetyl esterase
VALEPEAKAVIEAAAKAGRPAYHQLGPKDARQLFRDTRPLSTPVPPEIWAVRNLAAEGRHGHIPLRVYRPAGVAAGAALPVYVYFHGGGWVIGDLETHDVTCRQLTAASGACVVSVDYRLAPEHKFPVSVDDAWDATRWIVAHAGELGADGRRLAVGGDSAGGNLAAVVALMARDAEAPTIALQVMIYPVTDLGAESASYTAFADGYLLSRDSMRWFRAHYLTDPAEGEDWRASPLRAKSLAGVAPALIVTAGSDPLRDEGEAYAARLRDAGVLVDYVCFGGMIHGFAGMGKVLATAHRAVALIGGALRQAFGG